MTAPVGTAPDADPGPAAADRRGAYPTLTGEQVEVLARGGTRRSFPVDGVLFRAGDPRYELMAITSGRVAVVDGHGTPQARVLVEHGAGRFLGELNLLTGQAVYLTAVALEPTEVVSVPPQALRQVLAQEPALSDILMRALLLRRCILLGTATGLRVVGSRYSADTGRLLEFLARARVPATWLDLETDPGAEQLLTAAGVGAHETPVVLAAGGELLRNPSNAALAAAVGLTGAGATAGGDDVWDLVVVGSGPAGLAASVYGASEGLRTLAVDAVAAGGQAGTSSRIENYLGFPAGLSGSDLAARAVVQAEKFGARLTSPCEAAAIRSEGALHVLTLTSGDEIPARAVVLATGARYRRLEVPDLARFEGTSVYYAATHAEASRCADRPVVVVGGGNSAGQAAIHLARFAASVTIMVRRPSLEETMSSYLVNEIAYNPRITVQTCSAIADGGGEGRLEWLDVRDTTTGEVTRRSAQALFLLLGAEPHCDWLPGAVARDSHGFVLTGRDVPPTAWADGRPPANLATTLPGVFAVGDIRSGSMKRVAAASGEGSSVVPLVHSWLAP